MAVSMSTAAVTVFVLFVGTAGIAGIIGIARRAGLFTFERRGSGYSVRLAVRTVAVCDELFMATAIVMVLVLLL